MSEENNSNAIERTLSILELVTASQKGLSNADLSRRLNIPKSSASYILRVLEKRGYLNREESGKYRIGLKLVSLTSGALTHLDFREIAKPIMSEFLKKSRLPEVHLAVLDNGRAVYVEKIEADNSFIKMDIWVGHRLPIHTTAIGKTLVAYLPEAEILRILELRGMDKKTRKSITSPQKFLQELEKVRKYGYAIDDEENSDNVRCLAAPVYDSNGKIIASFGASTIINQLDKALLPKIIEMVKDSAKKVSKSLGFIE
jgi:IclR family transcriptional regulator, KDG regulon repressor